MPTLLPISVFDMNRELTYTTCAIHCVHGPHTYSTCASVHCAHAKRTYNLHGAAHCSQCGSRGFLRKRIICSYSNSFTDLGSAAILEWKPTFDNILLVVSIALAYIAGIVTPSSPGSLVSTTSAPLNKSQEVPNVQEEVNDAIGVGAENIWSEAHLKLSKGVDRADDMQEDISGQGGQLSLQALARGPRLRLLLITLEQLNKEWS